MERDTINLWKSIMLCMVKLWSVKYYVLLLFLYLMSRTKWAIFAQYDKGGSVNHVTMFYVSSIAFARLF